MQGCMFTYHPSIPNLHVYEAKLLHSNDSIHVVQFIELTNLQEADATLTQTI